MFDFILSDFCAIIVIINNVENEYLKQTCVESNCLKLPLLRQTKPRNRQKSLVPFASYWSNFGADDFLKLFKIF